MIDERHGIDSNDVQVEGIESGMPELSQEIVCGSETPGLHQWRSRHVETRC